ncbi:MAG: tetratricopeptide repeat protein [Limisphaerales bacterium]
MKTLLLAAAFALAVPALHAATVSPVPEGGAPATPAPLDAAFQEALLLEEGRRDLPGARRAYEAVVAQADAQRALAATAVFRLGEVHRKLGRTNDAVAQYRRLLRDFPGEETLAKLSRENLAALGAPLAERGGDAPVAEGVRGAPPRDPGPAVSSPPSAGAAEEIARLEAQLAMFRDRPLDDPATLIALQQAFPDAQLARLEETILEVQSEVSVLDSQTTRDHPVLAGKLRQLKELEAMLVNRALAMLAAQELRLQALKAALPGQVTFFGDLRGTLDVPPGGTLSLADSILRLKPTNLTDLRRVRVHRPAAEGGTNSIVEVNVRDLLRDNDRSKDVQLHPGDRVEIPHRVL